MLISQPFATYSDRKVNLETVNQLFDYGLVITESDTGKCKIANGIHNYIDLPYMSVSNIGENQTSTVNNNLRMVGSIENLFTALRPQNWLVCDGSLITNADTNVPELYEYLLNNLNLTTDNDTYKYMSNTHLGVGGVHHYVLDTSANTIRIPDLRDYDSTLDLYALNNRFKWCVYVRTITDESNLIPATVYQYDHQNAYVGIVFAYNYEFMPYNTTVLAPPTRGIAEIQIWNGTSWDITEDHRGKTGYNGAMEVVIDTIGPLPSWFTTEPVYSELDLKTQRYDELGTLLDTLNTRFTNDLRLYILDPENVTYKTQIVATQQAVYVAYQEYVALINWLNTYINSPYVPTDPEYTAMYANNYEHILAPVNSFTVDNTANIATKAWVLSQITDALTTLISSITTPTEGDDSSSIATTEFVNTAITNAIADIPHATTDVYGLVKLATEQEVLDALNN
jgi:hypothetical protein